MSNLKHRISIYLGKSQHWCESEIELTKESDEQGEWIGWTEGFDFISIDFIDHEYEYNAVDMSEKVYDMIKEKIGEAVADMTIEEARNLEYNEYESTLDL